MVLEGSFDFMSRNKDGPVCECSDEMILLQYYPLRIATREDFSILLEVISALLGFHGFWDLHGAEICMGCGLMYLDEAYEDTTVYRSGQHLDDALLRRCIGQLSNILLNGQCMRIWAYPDYARYTIQQCRLDPPDVCFARVLDFIMREYHFGGGSRHTLVSYGDWD